MTVNPATLRMPAPTFLWLIVAVAFVGVGHVGPWVALAWAVMFTLLRSSDRARLTSFMGPLFVAVIAGALAWPNYILIAAVFLLAALTGIALNIALDQLEEGNTLGLLLLAVVWLTGPSAVGAAALAAAAYLSAALRQRGAQRTQTPRAVVPVVLAAVAFAAAALLIPRPPAMLERITASLERENVAVRPAPARGGLFGAPLTGMLPGAVPPRAPVRTGNGDDNDRFIPLLVFLALPLIGALALLVGRRLRFGRTRRPTWLDAVEIVALAGTAIALLLLVMALIRTRYVDGESTGEGRVTDESTGAFDALLDAVTDMLETIRRFIEPLLDRFGGTLFALMVLGAFLGMSMLAYGLWVLSRTPGGRVLDEHTASAQTSTAPASSRVRRAYTLMLRHAGERGVARRVTETPAEFARRAGNAFPGAQADIAALTGLYLPVRYGRHVTDEHAEEAEAALQRIRTQLLRDNEPDTERPGPQREGPTPETP